MELQHIYIQILQNDLYTQKIVSIRVKTISNTNLVASSNIKREKGSLTVHCQSVSLKYVTS